MKNNKFCDTTHDQNYRSNKKVNFKYNIKGQYKNYIIT